MSAVVSGLIGAVAAIALAGLAARTQKSAAMLHDGWRGLRPSWLVHCSMVFCFGFAGVISYFLLNGGSGRTDASTQNLVACLLLAAVVGGAIYIGWTSYFITVQWKGNKIRIRPIIGRDIVHKFSDVAKVKNAEIYGVYRLKFRDGSRLWFSEHMHGAKDLAAKLPKRAFTD